MINNPYKYKYVLWLSLKLCFFIGIDWRFRLSSKMLPAYIHIYDKVIYLLMYIYIYIYIYIYSVYESIYVDREMYSIIVLAYISMRHCGLG